MSNIDKMHIVLYFYQSQQNQYEFVNGRLKS